MNILRNILAVVGVVSIVVLIYAAIKIQPVMHALEVMDPAARTVYTNLFKRIITTESGVDAMVYKVPVQKGLTPADVDESIRYIANELNIKNVGELPLSKEIESLSGSKYRFVKIYLMCNAITAASMMNYNDAFSSFLPCRITLLEDKTGQLWLYTLDMGVMIYGGKPLPPALKEEALKVQKIITSIMNRAAVGDF